MNDFPLGTAVSEVITGDNKYSITLHLENLMPGLPIGGTLESRGSLLKNYPKPSQFNLKVDFNDLEQNKKLVFDWQHNQVISGHKHRKTDITTGTLDYLSMLLALQQDLSKKHAPLSYTLTDGKHKIVYEFEQVGEEEVKTVLKTYHTIVLKSKNQDENPQLTLWFAPEDQHLLVQIAVNFVQDLSLKATLSSLS